jgi:pyrroloquinoline quinone biosynthesis protein B
VRILILGAAAGGGFPQWNTNDPTAQRARLGDPNVLPQTQSSVAVSADEKRWVLFNASPDLPQQIRSNRQLQPLAGDPLRSSPIASVVLTNADVDHVAGLLNLRESQPLSLYGHQRVLDVLGQNNIFNVLNPAFVDRRALILDQETPLRDRAGVDLDLAVTAFAVPGKVALWLEDQNAKSFGTGTGDTIGLKISTADAAFFYIPGCAAMTPELAERLRGSPCVLFDGTLWRDDEMIVSGVGTKTGMRMGHMSCEGPAGTLAAFRDLNVAHKMFIHVNNSNPLLIANSPERQVARSAGWEIAQDGMEIML